MELSSPVDGYRLAHDRAGTGRPVVLLHGWPGDRSDFADVAARLSADVLRPDLRGFGESDKAPAGSGGSAGRADPVDRAPAAGGPAEPADFGAAGQARSVVGLLDELGLSRVVLAGYDVGSRVAQTIAANYPDRVAALVVAPPLPGAGRRVLDPDAQSEFWYQAFHQLRLVEELIDGRPDAVRAYLRHFWSHWSGPDFTPTDARLDHLTSRYGGPGAFTASIGWYRAGSAMIRSSLAETPPATRIGAPTTVLWPEFDPLFPRAWSDRLGEWFADVELRHLDGVGHFSPVEAPDAFAASVTEAVERASST
ncbi:MAG TPA: alpha/beta hydrolase [Pseudonocardia sp.]|jgi:pimeloyl-ACP methyl ester carboxylesterase|nr:alpha/beta hydrolase [Pseudonocardia sp.]